ncbi:MAG: GNAT family N-acetyltransferase [Alphaproteobacteria bacterium]|jgi:ribosomal protein S18 acetylase RimI-like enzyme|nr:GNAT family N-acetyltransferase [Alphaproteobacteria bacterium]
METLIIRPYRSEDLDRVKAIFIEWNRHIAGPENADAFEVYIQRALEAEILHIPDFYQNVLGCGFWVADLAGDVIGMAGIERVGDAEAEVRRMYVDAAHRRRGIGVRLLSHVEDFCIEEGYAQILLSTSEMQEAALALYRAQGYRLDREEVADEMTNRTIGGGVRRFYFVKDLAGSG